MSEAPSAPEVSDKRDPLIGSVVAGRFRIDSVIGKGGMGVVYRATQEGLGRVVALKVMQLGNLPFGEREQFEKRFALEASACARLQHPNLVKVFDYGQMEGGGYFIAMEFLRGRSLHSLITQAGALPPKQVLGIVRQIAGGLREAHQLGMVHRDLKPDNILLLEQADGQDFVKVIDFGLVKDLGRGEDLTKVGAYMGTPKYMAPEQVRGAAVDRRTDLYSLGIVTYTMLTKRAPFAEPTPLATIIAQIKQPPPWMGEVAPGVVVPRILELIVRKMLAKAPEDRFDDMDAFLGALDKFELGVLGEAEVTTHFDLAAPIPRSGQEQEDLGNEQTVLAEGAVPRPGGRSKRLWGALVISGACVFGGLLGLLPSDANDPSASPAAAMELPPTQPRGGEEPARGATAAVSPARASRESKGDTGATAYLVKVALSSTPPGATVQIHSQKFGPTPTVAEVYGTRPWESRELTVVFSLAGHVTSSVTQLVDGPHLRVHAALEKTEGGLTAARDPVIGRQQGDMPTRAQVRTSPRTASPPAKAKNLHYRSSPY